MNVRIVFLLAVLLPCSTASAKDENGSWLASGRQWVRGLWQGEAEQWLDRINPALMAYDYKGTLVFVHGNLILQIAHALKVTLDFRTQFRRQQGFLRRHCRLGGRE